MKLLSRLALVLVLIITAVACTSQSKKSEQQPPGEITISNPWARPADKGSNSAVYLTISNTTAAADTLIGVETTAADMASVHKTFHENGMTGMRHVKTIVIEDGSKLVLEPGGYHIMLMGLNQNLQKGDTLKLDLKFSAGGVKRVLVPVKTIN